MKLRIAGLAVAALIALTACGGTGSDPSSTAQPTPTLEEGTGSPVLDKIKSRGILLAGIASDLPGVSFQQPNSSTYQGFDIKLIQLIADNLDFGPSRKIPHEVRFRSVPTNTRLNIITSGDVDLAFALKRPATQGTTTRSPQASSVGFVGPYLPAQQALLVRSGTTSVPSGKNVCVVAGTGAGEKLRAAGITNNVTEQTSSSQCVEALKAGSVDAFSSDNVILLGYQKENSGLKVLDKKISTEDYYIAVPNTRDSKLRAKLLEILQKAVNDGTWARLYQESFGVAPAQLPTFQTSSTTTSR